VQVDCSIHCALPVGVVGVPVCACVWCITKEREGGTGREKEIDVYSQARSISAR